MKWHRKYELSFKDKISYNISLLFVNIGLRGFTAYWKEGHSFPQEAKKEFYKSKSHRNTLLSLLTPYEDVKRGKRFRNKSHASGTVHNPVLDYTF